MQQNHKGFTLIELMIVVAIIGILAAVAIPQYQRYTRESLATKMISEAKVVQSQISICAQIRPLDNCRPGSPYVSYIGNRVFVSFSGFNNSNAEVLVTGEGPFAGQDLVFKSDETGMDWSFTCAGSDNNGVKNNLCYTRAVTEHPHYSP